VKNEKTWLNKRAAGVLLHPTSLPSEQGIGSLGTSAYRLIDFLAASGMKYWQVCPLGPTGYGDSPYQCFSAFAGNPYLVDLKELVMHGLLAGSDLAPLQKLPHDEVNFGELYKLFWPLIKKAFHSFQKKKANIETYGDYDTFKQEEAHWLHPHACFMACKDHFHGMPWHEWPRAYRTFAEAQKRPLFLFNELSEQIEAHKFYQYLFLGQWKLVLKYAQEKGIEIIGDIPIFVSLDSSDVWANAHLFQLNANGTPSKVAGVPPDYFSPTGQLWGNPLYDWKEKEGDVFKWWQLRIKHTLRLYDVVRIDHFRGFDTYWSIPAGSKDASVGKWVKGPGKAFFDAMNKSMPGIKWIAEDLGDINDDVRELRDSLGLPGMAIMQFAFSNDSSNLYLPHNLSRNCVYYPGTHDNDTAWGWYRSTSRESRDQFRRYFRVSGESIPWDMIRGVYQSVSRLVVIPMQDLMNKGPDARMNLPGKPDGNWKWRYTVNELERLFVDSAHYLQELASLYYR